MTREEASQPGSKSNALRLTLAWLAVGVPLLWGVVETLRKAMALFA
jgi:predicted signal transduction protein with EAL and GGDEF domain